MGKGRITVDAVEDLKPGETLWDETVKGFGVRRQRKAAVYVFKHRVGGKQRFETIGRHGSPWTPSSAREQARRLAGALPSTAATGGRLTFGVLSETYMDRYAAAHKKPRSLAEDRRNLDLHILPMLGKLPLTGVTRDVLSRFHAERRAQPGAPAMRPAVRAKVRNFGLLRPARRKPSLASPAMEIAL